MDDQLKFYSDKLAYEIDSWDLKAALDADEKIVVVDARSPGAFQREHIPGAINIPHRTISPDTTSQIDRGSLVGCNACTKGAVNMVRLGFRVKELIGGLDWWKRDGYPTHAAAASGEAAACGCA